MAFLAPTPDQGVTYTVLPLQCNGLMIRTSTTVGWHGVFCTVAKHHQMPQDQINAQNICSLHFSGLALAHSTSAGLQFRPVLPVDFHFIATL
jgi:hypothetical protein